MESEERIRSLRVIVDDNPRDPLSHFLLGVELVKISRFSEAADAFRASVEIDPLYTAAWRELGKALAKAGDELGARSALGRAIEVAEITGDLQTKREAEVFVRRLGNKSQRL